MNSANIGIFLVLATLVVIFVVSVCYMVFSRFIAKEKERGERFREIHLKPPDER